MADSTKSTTLAALLAWHRDIGVDDVVGDQPLDWLARGDGAPPGYAFRSPSTIAAAPEAAPARAAATPHRPPVRAAQSRPVFSPASAAPAPAPPRQFPTASPDAALMAARAGARDANSLPELQAALAAFDGCALKATAKNLCF